MTIDDSHHWEYLERALGDNMDAQRSLGVLKVKYGWLEARAEEFSRAVVSWKDNEEIDAARIRELEIRLANCETTGI